MVHLACDYLQVRSAIPEAMGIRQVQKEVDDHVFRLAMVFLMEIRVRGFRSVPWATVIHRDQSAGVYHPVLSAICLR